ncbi:AraC family transcriptional regulator [Cohnella lubricantis]|uniref:AraC family transcriptional regulator n=1 Tax=Cohnella lubricantis TaxID=2163172 RepID=A0A841T3H7_9BACL|nr:AraC family transcriptional regulator [Cohnella lubricantis]MBB6675884.1 AraC family transcriptional regulator [Cohnella lubricantis]MBP2117199.1 AraC-like DNA-binding protein [Cohnella lubricantis]
MRRFVTNLGITQIFLSLLLVILLMSASTYSIYRASISNIYGNIKENNEIATQSAMQYIDNAFQTINHLIRSLEQMPPYEYPVMENGNLDSVQARQFISNMTSLMTTADYIDEIIVLFDNEDLAITTKGTIDIDLLFNNKYMNPTYSASYWKQYLNTEHYFKVFPSSEYQVHYTDNQSNYKEELMFVVSDNHYTKSEKNIIIILDTNQLIAHLGQTTLIPGSSLKILDQNQNTIFSTDHNLELVEVINDLFVSDQPGNRSEISLKDNDFEYTVYTSDYNNFVYISKVPYEFKNLNAVAHGNRTIIWISIASAVLLSLLLSIYLYRPVRKIMKLLGGENSKGDDFSKIQSGITKLRQENQQYANQLVYVDSELKRSTFLQMIDDYTHSGEHELQLQKYYPSFFNANYFVMALVQVRERSVLKGYSLPVESIADHIRSCLAQEDVEAQAFHYLHDQFFVLVSLRQANEREAVLRRIGRAFARLEKESLIGFVLRACVSKAYRTTIDNGRNAYRDVENAYKYRNVNAAAKVMDADQIPFVWNVYLPYEQMEKMTNYMMNGRVEESIAIIKVMLKENIERNIHDHQFKFVASSIFFYLFRQIGSMTHSVRELYRIENEFVLKLEYANQYDEIENAIMEAVEQLAKYGGRTVEAKLNPAFIAQYIELHYMENLYLDHIAKVMDTTPKYFSNYFKKTFDINYIEYLNKVRLSHARTMLKETSLSIGEIGEKTGYLNSSTFTTTFKKYYGISPSEYRRQAIGKDEGA